MSNTKGMNMVPAYIAGWVFLGVAIFSMAQCTMASSQSTDAAKTALSKQCHDEGYAWETSWGGWCNRDIRLPTPSTEEETR